MAASASVNKTFYGLKERLFVDKCNTLEQIEKGIEVQVEIRRELNRWLKKEKDRTPFPCFGFIQRNKMLQVGQLSDRVGVTILMLEAKRIDLFPEYKESDDRKSR